MKNKFVLGLVTAVILGIFINIILGYIKFGYFQNSGAQNYGKPIDKDIKECQGLVAGSANFGNLKVTVFGNGMPLESLEVDVSTKPGPVRCMQKTDKNGVALFKNVPIGRMFIFFNQSASPKKFGQMPTETIEIIKGQLLEKNIELKSQ